MIKLQDILMGCAVIAIVIFMWSWASNPAPRFFMQQPKIVDCADCPYDDLAQCDACVEIFNQRMPD